MKDDPPLRLVSDRPKGWESESLPRLAVRPRYRQRALAPRRSKLIEAKPRIGGETDGGATK